MLESRNSYGYGYVGSSKKGFEWLLIYGYEPYDRLKSGHVYKTEKQALTAGKKFKKENTTYKDMDCQITAIKSDPLHFSY